MKYRRKPSRNHYLENTQIENIYIAEYMAMAPGDFVKVYLFASMCAGTGTSISEKNMAKQLFVEPEIIHAAWDYWEAQGVITKKYKNESEYSVEFVILKEKLYCKGDEGSTEKEPETKSLCDNDIKEMFASIQKILGRVFDGREPMVISSWIDDFGANPEMITCAYNYCVKTIKKNHVNYIGSVVKEWAAKGLTDREKIEEHLAEIDQRYFLYKRIFKALGFSRNATEEERRLMDAWFDQLEMSLDQVLNACAKTAGTGNPNIKYVDKVLHGWAEGKESPDSAGADGPVKIGTVLKYYDYIREEIEKEAQWRKEKIYSEIPQIRDIDEQILELSMKTSKAMLAGGIEAARETKRLKKEIGDRLAQKATLLTEHNYPMDYLEIKYGCNACKDTGTTDTGERCACFENRLEEAKQWQNSLTSSSK